MFTPGMCLGMEEFISEIRINGLNVLSLYKHYIQCIQQFQFFSAISPFSVHVFSFPKGLV